ncbi:MAG: hypothetical protein ABTS22_00740 [Accumulibacter sp.]
MNALFGAGIKGFLTLLQAQDAVRQDHGDGADGADRPGPRGIRAIGVRHVALHGGCHPLHRVA